jgi:hypothetical protein
MVMGIPFVYDKVKKNAKQKLAEEGGSLINLLDVSLSTS